MLPPLPRCSRWAYSSLKLTHPYQPSPKPLSGRPAHRPFRGLLGVHSRCGLHTRAVTKIVTVIRRLQTFRHLHACSGCFRLERSPGGPCTHWKSAAFSRRTWSRSPEPFVEIGDGLFGNFECERLRLCRHGDLVWLWFEAINRALASPCSHRFAPPSSGEPVRPLQQRATAERLAVCNPVLTARKIRRL